MELKSILQKLYEILQSQNKEIATAESCTGGLIGKTLTEVPGISAHYGYGFITYSNEAKQKLLGVSSKTLEAHGAVSGETVVEMASGALKVSGADVAVSVSGIAGPGGGTKDKPVGLVYIGIASENASHSHKFIFSGTRDEVREKTLVEALKLVINELEK